MTNRNHSARLFATAFSLPLLCCSCGERLTQLPSLPGAGLSGLYAGQAGEKLYIAGGCNFPDKPLTEGGAKKFYDDILVLGEKGWEKAGVLPEASAYGAYIQTEGGILIMGGANANGTLDKVWLLSEDGVEELPPLPKALEQAAWCGAGDVIYLAGGLSNGEPSLDVFSFTDGQWSVIGELPRPMVQAVAVMCGDDLCIWGGLDPVSAEALTGGFRRNALSGEWSGLGADITFTGSAPMGNCAAGGCDPEILTRALRLTGDEVQEYRLQPEEYYRFRGELLVFDSLSCSWERVVSSPHLARAGAALANFRGGIVSIGGETKPGIRSKEVWMIDGKL
ncbi:MAG: hypothetical protein MJY61_00985 [Bacteroidales bacterium]|nr:hypothetical protein [Bacteroidales bacterium]